MKEYGEYTLVDLFGHPQDWNALHNCQACGGVIKWPNLHLKFHNDLLP